MCYSERRCTVLPFRFIVHSHAVPSLCPAVVDAKDPSNFRIVQAWAVASFPRRPDGSLGEIEAAGLPPHTPTAATTAAADAAAEGRCSSAVLSGSVSLSTPGALAIGLARSDSDGPPPDGCAAAARGSSQPSQQQPPQQHALPRVQPGDILLRVGEDSMLDKWTRFADASRRLLTQSRPLALTFLRLPETQHRRRWLRMQLALYQHVASEYADAVMQASEATIAAASPIAALSATAAGGGGGGGGGKRGLFSGFRSLASGLARGQEWQEGRSLASGLRLPASREPDAAQAAAFAGASAAAVDGIPGDAAAPASPIGSPAIAIPGKAAKGSSSAGAEHPPLPRTGSLLPPRFPRLGFGSASASAASTSMYGSFVPGSAGGGPSATSLAGAALAGSLLNRSKVDAAGGGSASTSPVGAGAAGPLASTSLPSSAAASLLEARAAAVETAPAIPITLAPAPLLPGGGAPALTDTDVAAGVRRRRVSSETGQGLVAGADGTLAASATSVSMEAPHLRINSVPAIAAPVPSMLPGLLATRTAPLTSKRWVLSRGGSSGGGPRHKLPPVQWLPELGIAFDACLRPGDVPPPYADLLADAVAAAGAAAAFVSAAAGPSLLSPLPSALGGAFQVSAATRAAGATTAAVAAGTSPALAAGLGESYQGADAIAALHMARSMPLMPVAGHGASLLASPSPLSGAAGAGGAAEASSGISAALARRRGGSEGSPAALLLLPAALGGVAVGEAGAGGLATLSGYAALPSGPLSSSAAAGAGAAAGAADVADPVLQTVVSTRSGGPSAILAALSAPSPTLSDDVMLSLWHSAAAVDGFHPPAVPPLLDGSPSQSSVSASWQPHAGPPPPATPSLSTGSGSSRPVSLPASTAAAAAPAATAEEWSFEAEVVVRDRTAARTASRTIAGSHARLRNLALDPVSSLVHMGSLIAPSAVGSGGAGEGAAGSAAGNGGDEAAPHPLARLVTALFPERPGAPRWNVVDKVLDGVETLSSATTTRSRRAATATQASEAGLLSPSFNAQAGSSGSGMLAPSSSASTSISTGLLASSMPGRTASALLSSAVTTLTADGPSSARAPAEAVVVDTTKGF